jgi:hypothetical protein
VFEAPGNEAELRKLPGFGARCRLDGFLKTHGVLIDDYTIEDLRRDVEALRRLGF